MSSANTPPARQSGNLDEEQIVGRLMQAQRERAADIKSLSRIQRYTASDRRFGVQAEMVARMIYEKGEGKRFEVISRSGSTTIQSRIFDGLIAAEVEASQKYRVTGSPTNTDNYNFRLLGKADYDGRECYLLRLEPRHKSENLINGKAWVDATDFEIIHEEGRTGASVSFWVGKPTINADYEKIGKFWIAKRRYSVSDSFLLGRSELNVDYTGYHITEVEHENPPTTP